MLAEKLKAESEIFKKDPESSGLTLTAVFIERKAVEPKMNGDVRYLT